MADNKFWIARDKDGSLWLHDNKPFCSSSGTWYSYYQMRIRNNDRFPEVTFKNSPQEFQLCSTMDLAVIKTSLNASKINLEKADKSWERDLMLTDIDNVLSRID